ncbi:hypothetical protein NC653_037660 [Populus alba x Populus x berolinensis]|uniref:Uncharacterized protein n=1 Tax=Populus alba x Populus x berolinensis TaxID=444605 RepID=A0AAD6PT71_9ROSI|nr:hypothetical protein NC653_037660 [Populus alba x Populus x berolinensis]
MGLKGFAEGGIASIIAGASTHPLDLIKVRMQLQDTNTMPLVRKIVAGLIFGAVGNPPDVAMVRMQADGRLPIEQRRNYKSVVDALSQMSKAGGCR